MSPNFAASPETTSSPCLVTPTPMTIALDWVNCVGLMTSEIKTIEELGDGKFFREVLQTLFYKQANIESKAQIFHELEDSLKNFCTPSGWIDFKEACNGSGTELVKIITILMGIYTMQTLEQTAERLEISECKQMLLNDSLMKTTKQLQCTQKELVQVQQQLHETKTLLEVTTKKNLNKPTSTQACQKLPISNEKLHSTTKLLENPLNVRKRNTLQFQLVLLFGLIFLLILRIPREVLITTYEIIVGRADFSYLAEKHGRLQHAGAPII